MTRSLAVGLLLVLLSSTAVAQPAQGGEAPGGAQGGGPDAEQMLSQAVKYYEALEYESALKVLLAVQQLPNVAPMQKALAFLYMGVCFTALGHAQNAVASFVELLKLKPDFRLPSGTVSPSIHAMFKEALKQLKLPETPPPQGQGQGGEGGAGGGAASPPGRGGPASDVTVEASVVGSAKPGRPVDIAIEVTDPKRQVEDVVLHWRLVGGPDFSAIRIKFQPGQKKVTGRIPGALTGHGAGRLQFIVEALGRGGLTLARAGSEGSPMEAELEPPPKSRSRWGWYVLGIGGGAAIVGGIVAAILLTRGQDGPAPPTTASVSATVR